MRTGAIFAGLLVSVGHVEAFTALGPASSQRSTRLFQSADDECMSRRRFAGMIASAAAVAIAASPAKSNAFQASSSIQLSDSAIKTMDMGLPSYGAIAAPKASGETLMNEYEVPQEAAPKKERKKKPASDDDSNNPLGSVLPSMNKKKPKKQEKEAAAPKAKKQEKEAAAPKPKPEKQERGPKVEIVDFGMPSYSSAGEPKKSMFSI